MSNLGLDARPIAWLALLALIACALALLSGVGSALTYTDVESTLRASSLTLAKLRPIHETFAFAWAFLGGVTVVHAWMIEVHGPLTAAERLRFRVQVGLWSAAGVGILATLLQGWFSGREYAGYHPAFSLLILAGWFLFAWNYFGRAGFSLRGKPVYQYMWLTGIALYVITSLEAHAYVLDFVSRKPLQDLAVQWKANGVMVGSFNQLVYGSLMWVSSRVRKSEQYAHSRTAFGLFTVGVLNTFTNYGHHTYHLPQSPWIHFISFGVSMLEIILLAKVLLDLWRLRRASAVEPAVAVPVRFAKSTTLWTFLMLALATALSVPSLNSLAHGTHVVTAHAMGSMIGIDSMVIWMSFAWILVELVGHRHRAIVAERTRKLITALDVLLAAWLAVFIARGLSAGVSRYVGPAAPDTSVIVASFPLWMTALGTALATVALVLLACWARAFVELARRGNVQRGISGTEFV
jgi:nitric oxide reductase subunit B